MLLSELVSLDEDTQMGLYYGIGVDGYFQDMPSFVKEIGLMVYEDEGTISLDLLDVLLACESSGIKTTLEVPADFSGNLEELILTASNCGSQVSLLTPENQLPESMDKYGERLKSVAKRWVSDTSSPKFIYPISSYFIYLVGEAVGYKPEEMTTDEYTKDIFVDGFSSIEEMDKIKDSIKEGILEGLGGENALLEFSHTLAQSLFDNTKAKIIDVGKRAEEEIKADALKEQSATEEDKAD